MNENAVGCLYVLYATDESMTTTELARKVFDPDDGSELKDADRKVRYYLEESVPHLVDVDAESGTKQFTLKPDAAFFGLGKVQIAPMLRGEKIESGEAVEEITIGLGEVMVFKSPDGEPEVLSISIGSDRNSDSEGSL